MEIGGRHSLALTTDGKVFSWGEGDDGKLGHFSRWNCDKPRLIEALKSKRVRDIACGSSHSAAITSNGDLYTWGLGEYGRLGHGDNTTQLKPKQVRIWEYFIDGINQNKVKIYAEDFAKNSMFYPEAAA